MIFRFSLYGFLRNQRYFEPFLILAFLQVGLSFFEIGLLVAFRELCVNVLEIPSGAIADLYGRRRALMLSFAAYVVGFLTFGFSDQFAFFFAAMFCLAVGDAFRTGTHKAMIFTWLRLRGRTAERTKVYGYTRSWSKIGSAVSALIAAAFVLATDSYTLVFFLAAVPYVGNIINFFGYPAELEGDPEAHPRPGQVLVHMRDSLRSAFGAGGLRLLVLESMGFEGIFHAVKDYLQPILLATSVGAASGLAFGGDLSEVQRSALLIGPVYFVLHMLSSAASRNAHRVARAAGGEDGAARWMWGAAVVVFAVILAAGLADVPVVLILAFIALSALQDLWRPVLIARFDEHSNEAQGATVLSIESQARRFATMLLAPLLGLAVDGAQGSGSVGPFWPLGAVGLVAAIAFFVTAARRPSVVAVPELLASEPERPR
ncbi:MAG: MFS transporter [Chloroflexi bacterium]|nr:MFS transporter [Chloroflexota bacterium]